jgi:hypothetical protein
MGEISIVSPFSISCIRSTCQGIVIAKLSPHKRTRILIPMVIKIAIEGHIKIGKKEDF